MTQAQAVAAVVRQPGGPFLLDPIHLDGPRADEVLVRIVSTAICTTDLAVRAGHFPVPFPVVLGHEATAVVEHVGSAVRKVAPGDSVILTYKPCGHCPHCAEGRPTHCLHLFESNFACRREDGSTTLADDEGPIHGGFFGQSSFATHALAYEANLVRVPEGAPLDRLAPLGCGVQTGAGTVLNTLHPPPGSSIAIFGTGAVGLSAVMAAKVAGCATIVGIDVRPERLALARELGATHAFDANACDPSAELKALGGVDFSVEATGDPAVLRQAVEALLPGGVCALIGAAPFGTQIQLDASSIFFGRTLKGALEGDSVADTFIPELLDLHLQGRLPFDRLISFYPFAEVEHAADDMREGRVVQAVLRM